MQEMFEETKKFRAGNNMKINDPEIQGKIIVGKNKYGSIGFCPITFYKVYSKFI